MATKITKKERSRPERNIDDDGIWLRVKCYPEVWEGVTRWAKRRARRRRNEGYEVPPGELRGASHQVGALYLWFLELCEADREAILARGAELKKRLDGLPPDYDGPLPFKPREDSVFRPDLLPGAGQGAGGRSRPLPAKRGRQAEGQDAAPAGRPDHAPAPV